MISLIEQIFMESLLCVRYQTDKGCCPHGVYSLVWQRQIIKQFFKRENNITCLKITRATKKQKQSRIRTSGVGGGGWFAILNRVVR